MIGTRGWDHSICVSELSYLLVCQAVPGMSRTAPLHGPECQSRRQQAEPSDRTDGLGLSHHKAPRDDRQENTKWLLHKKWKGRLFFFHRDRQHRPIHSKAEETAVHMFPVRDLTQHLQMPRKILLLGTFKKKGVFPAVLIFFFFFLHVAFFLKVVLPRRTCLSLLSSGITGIPACLPFTPSSSFSSSSPSPPSSFLYQLLNTH